MQRRLIITFVFYENNDDLTGLNCAGKWFEPEGFVERSIPAEEWARDEENEEDDGEAERRTRRLRRQTKVNTSKEIDTCTEQVQ